MPVNAPVALAVVLLIMVVGAYCLREGFLSPDGVVARRSQRQLRSDPFDGLSVKGWTQSKLKECVRFLNNYSTEP
jgi:hypothetical protein